ncbi:MAG: hypothetical protein EP343_12935 [Deltaproteobacteria bacterium]|nr:MAG: hypothetical protein EP343_12935 [Deltaproteobacteria bacterium]
MQKRRSTLQHSRVFIAMGLSIFALVGLMQESQAKTIRLNPIPVIQIDAHPEQLPNAMRVLKTSPLLAQLLRGFRPGERLARNGLFDPRCSLHFKATANPGSMLFFSKLRKHSKAVDTLAQQIKALHDKKPKGSKPQSKLQAKLHQKAIAALIAKNRWLYNVQPKDSLFSLYLSLCPTKRLLGVVKKTHKPFAGLLPGPFRRFRSVLRSGEGTRMTSKTGILWHVVRGSMQAVIYAAPTMAKTKQGLQRWSVGVHLLRTLKETALDTKTLQSNFPHRAPTLGGVNYVRTPLLGATMHPNGLSVLAVVEGHLQATHALRYAAASKRDELQLGFMRLLLHSAKVLPLNSTRATSRSVWLGTLKDRIRLRLIDKDRNRTVTLARAKTISRQRALSQRHKNCLISLAFGVPEAYIRQTPIETRMFGKTDSKKLKRAIKDAGIGLQTASFAGGEWAAMMSALQSRTAKTFINANMKDKALHIPAGQEVHTFGFCLRGRSLDVSVALPNIAGYQKWFAGIKAAILKQMKGKSLQPLFKKLLSQIRLHDIPASSPVVQSKPTTLFVLDAPRIHTFLNNPKNIQTWQFLQKVLRKQFSGIGGWLVKFPLFLQVVSFKIQATAHQAKGHTIYTVDFTAPRLQPKRSSRKPSTRPASRPASRR